MLNDAKGFSRIIIACGRTDLRRGIDGLAAVVQEQFQLDPTEKNVLFLFCGTKTDRIKGLIFEGDGYLLIYNGAFPINPPVKRHPSNRKTYKQKKPTGFP